MSWVAPAVFTIRSMRGAVIGIGVAAVHLSAAIGPVGMTNASGGPGAVGKPEPPTPGALPPAALPPAAEPPALPPAALPPLPGVPPSSDEPPLPPFMMVEPSG